MIRTDVSIHVEEEKPSITEYKDFLEGLLAKIQQSPQTKSLRITDLSEEFNYSIEDVKDFLELVKLNFQLYQALNQQSSSIKSASSENSISMSIRQLQNLSDFHYISSKFPVKSTSTSKHPEFLALIEKFPKFVVNDKKGYITSEIGAAVAQQVLAYKRLNSFPKAITVNNLEIKILQEEK